MLGKRAKEQPVAGLKNFVFLNHQGNQLAAQVLDSALRNIIKAYIFIVTIFVTNFVTFKRNVMNKDGTKRRIKSPEKPVNTRKNALDET